MCERIDSSGATVLNRTQPTAMFWPTNGGLAGPGTVIVTYPTHNLLQITLRPNECDSAEQIAQRLAIVLGELKVNVLQHFVFGVLCVYKEVLRAMQHALGGNITWPITWVEGSSCTGSRIAGMQLLAVRNAQVETIVAGDRPIGRVFSDELGTHCFLGALTPTASTRPPDVQAHETFESLEAALNKAGMQMRHLVRTWFFLNDILNWYSRFNEVRTRYYANCELDTYRLPASTAVSGKNPIGAHIVACAWAIKPHDKNLGIETVPSPAQCPATCYGSAFSRAIEIISPSHRQLVVSGTASVASDGRTLHVGDPLNQIELTMDVVGRILQLRQMHFAHITRALAYFKSPSLYPLFKAWCKRHNLGNLPVLHVCCDICRPDLLFEIELEATCFTKDHNV